MLWTLLRDLQITPVLVDIGASGQPPLIWADLAPQSTYIGFDPDAREIHEDRVAGYQRSMILNEAVTHDHAASDVPIYLTRSPYCSTTLPPNPAATAPWLERDLFLVEQQTRVRATTIDAVVTRFNLPGIDWLKLDTQGIDLRLINSISSAVRDRVLAIDTEPGLIPIYQQEDLFVDVHRDLTNQGFWLSDVTIGGFLRMRRTTLEAHATFDETYIRAVGRTTPAYLEARYLRTLEWLAAHQLAHRDYLLLWIIALVDRQYGFALDVHQEITRRFGTTDESRRLNTVTQQLMRRAHRARVPRSVISRAARPVRGLWRRRRRQA